MERKTKKISFPLNYSPDQLLFSLKRMPIRYQPALSRNVASSNISMENQRTRFLRVRKVTPTDKKVRSRWMTHTTTKQSMTRCITRSNTNEIEPFAKNYQTTPKIPVTTM